MTISHKANVKRRWPNAKCRNVGRLFIVRLGEHLFTEELAQGPTARAAWRAADKALKEKL